MRTLIKNTTVVTSDATGTVHHDAALVIDGETSLVNSAKRTSLTAEAKPSFPA